MRNQPGKKNSTTVLKTEIFLYFCVCMFECSNKHYFFFKKKNLEKGTHLKLQFDRFSMLNKFELTTSFMVTSR